MVNGAEPTAMFAAVHETVPVLAPAGGAVQENPAGAVTETKVIPAGTSSLSVTAPLFGPLLMTVTSNCMSLPASAGGDEGPTDFVTVKSLCAYATGATTSITHTAAHQVFRIS
jgi:hypothetical protein